MRHEVMLDLETLGTKPGSVIVAIGAVKMDMEELDNPVDKPDLAHFIVGEPFYTTISAADCQENGLKIDGSTVMWWLGQSEAARARLLDGTPESLAMALQQFSAWVGLTPLPVWGNGSDFDNVLLRGAYDALGYQAPWKYHQSRCFRTLKNMAPLELAPLPNFHAHDALEDARWQAEYLFNIMTYMRDDQPSFYAEQKR